MKPLFNFHKKQANIGLIMHNGNVYLSIEFTRTPTKFLKRTRLFFAKVLAHNAADYNLFFQDLTAWVESFHEDALLERLEDAPARYRPVIKAGNIVLDFNVESEEVLLPISYDLLPS